MPRQNFTFKRAHAVPQVPATQCEIGLQVLLLLLVLDLKRQTFLKLLPVRKNHLQGHFGILSPASRMIVKSVKLW